MFIKKQFYPSPWDEPKRPLQVKDNKYFHTKDDRWNSPYHSSPKQEQFYRRELHSHTPTPPSELKPMIGIKKLESRERLQTRMLEREQLQLKASQRVLKPDRCITPDLASTQKTGFDDPVEKTKSVNSWNKLNTLPKPSAQKVVNEFILQKDREAVKYIQSRIQAEEAELGRVKSWLTSNHIQLRSSFTQLQHKNQDLRVKAGLTKPPVIRSATQFVTSDRIDSLSTPKNPPIPKEQYIEHDFRGLITTDYPSVLQTLQQKRPVSVKDFPKRLSLYSSMKSVTSKPAEELSRTHSFTREDDDRNYVTESMAQLDEFNIRHGEVKGRVGFPRNHLDQLKF